MVGIIITGHGEFASGLTNALKLLTGDQDNIIGVNFKPQESESDLQVHLKEALQKLGKCEQIFILCDILGGSPFKNAFTLFYDKENIRILYGVNLGMAVELSIRAMSETGPTDMDAISEELIAIGQQQIGKCMRPQI
ncbi:MAG: hypothetical protein APF77_23585 [Clostridia bacterium BRH_c25]|nr:MAG: hypothetical protein APF77_23585 [Clostridia bacterium BRH_c25]